MLVMDYPRHVYSLEGGTWGLVIPPFHTGHLGLLPGTEVFMDLMSGAENSENLGNVDFCELLVTPFPRRVGELVRVECEMLDMPGVVESLVDAISSLGVNIVSQESTIVGQPMRHQVTLIIDLSPAHAGARYPEDREAAEFRQYTRNVPLADGPLVRVFESIVSRCLSYLAWEHSDGWRPRVRIRRIHSRRGVEHSTSIIAERRNSPHYHIGLEPEKAVGRRILGRLGIDLLKNLSYFVVSETEERVLRVYLYRNDMRTGLFHLGFYHFDEPRALSWMLRLVARVGFNIVNSLLRKESKRESVWEAVLEYRGEAPLPPAKANLAARMEWAACRLVEQANDEEIKHLRYHDARVGLPRYPKVRSKALRERRLEMHPEALSKLEGWSNPSLARKEAKPRGSVDDQWEPQRKQLSEALKRRSRQNPTSIFLSFPSTARQHAASLRKELEGVGFVVLDGMSNEGQPILEDIVEKIGSADAFIGIWHVEGNGAEFSVWLPFELGVAMSREKPRLIVRSDGLDPKIWNRIDPNQNKPGFSDFNFESTAVPKIVDHAVNNFLRQDGSRRIA